jgi:hypothetical protein
MSPFEITELTDADWVERVAARMLTLDRTLGGEDVHRIAVDLAGRARWRALSPEAAAEKAFDDPEAVDGV